MGFSTEVLMSNENSMDGSARTFDPEDGQMRCRVLLGLPRVDPCPRTLQYQDLVIEEACQKLKSSVTREISEFLERLTNFQANNHSGLVI